MFISAIYMKKVFSILLLLAASVVAIPSASAYSNEMNELATMMNEQIGDGISVAYDGDNIIFTFPASFFSDEEKELFSGMDSLQPLAPQLKKSLAESMGEETLSMFGTVFSQFDTGMVVRVDLGGATKDIVFTGAQLLDPEF